MFVTYCLERAQISFLSSGKTSQTMHWTRHIMLGFKLKEEGQPNSEPCVMINEFSFLDLIALIQ